MVRGLIAVVSLLAWPTASTFGWTSLPTLLASYETLGGGKALD